MTDILLLHVGVLQLISCVQSISLVDMLPSTQPHKIFSLMFILLPEWPNFIKGEDILKTNACYFITLATDVLISFHAKATIQGS